MWFSLLTEFRDDSVKNKKVIKTWEMLGVKGINRNDPAFIFIFSLLSINFHFHFNIPGRARDNY